MRCRRSWAKSLDIVELGKPAELFMASMSTVNYPSTQLLLHKDHWVLVQLPV